MGNNVFINNLEFSSTLIKTLTPPTWASPHKIIYEDEALKLLRFNEVDNSKPSILVAPPQAAHHSCVADFEKGKSLVETIVNNTDQSCYAIEWKPCTYMRSGEMVDDLVLQLDRCIDIIGGDIDLIGLCQAGWLSTIYTARFPSRVNKLIVGVAPIDFKADGGAIQEWANALPMMWYRSLVWSGGGLMLGQNMLVAFKMTNLYDRFFKDYMDLYDAVVKDDEKFKNRYIHFNKWYNYVQNLAGGWYLEIVERFFKNNELIKGTFTCLGERVDLSNIKCKTAMIAASEDDITLVNQCLNLSNYISTPKEDQLKMVIDNCGHVGAFIKPAGLKNEWLKALNL